MQESKRAGFPVPTTPRFNLDGKRDPTEWSGAFSLPYTNLSLFATGKIWLAVADHGSASNPRHVLHLFLEDIPIDNRPGTQIAPTAAAPLNRHILRIYIDHDRFTGDDTHFKGNDRYFEFDIKDGTQKASFSSSSIAGSFTWSKISNNPTGFKVKPGGCKPDSSTPTVDRCNAELEVPLLLPDTLPPSPDLEPGFGFAIAGQVNKGGFPEDVTSIDPPVQGTNEIRLRRRLHTVLLSRPKGFPLKLMSFNIHRFKSSAFQGDFEKVDNDSIGKFLAEQNADVVAIQEGWDRDQVKTILDAANKYRLAKEPKAKNISDTVRCSTTLLGRPPLPRSLVVFTQLKIQGFTQDYGYFHTWKMQAKVGTYFPPERHAWEKIASAPRGFNG